MLVQPAGKPEAWMRSTPSTQPTIAALPGRTNPHSEFSCTSDVFLTRGSDIELLIVDSLAEDRSRGRRAGKSQDHKLRMFRLRSSTVYTYFLVHPYFPLHIKLETDVTFLELSSNGGFPTRNSYIRTPSPQTSR